MEPTPTPSPTTMEASDTARPILDPVVTEGNEGPYEAADTAGVPSAEEQGANLTVSEQRVNNNSPGEDPTTYEDTEQHHPDQNIEAPSGSELPDQEHANDSLQPLRATGEVTYDWLKAIDARVASVEGKVVNLPSATDSTVNPVNIPIATDSTVYPVDDDSYMYETKPEVKDCHWEAFKNRFPTEDNAVPAIETLLRSTEIVAGIQEEQLKRQAQDSASPLAYQKPFKPSSKPPAPDDRYERIRINSAFIQAFLSKVVEDSPWANLPLKPLTFLRPFKLLVHFHEHMEKELMWLEEKFGSSVTANQTLTPETERPPAISVEEAVHTEQYVPARSHINTREQNEQFVTTSSTPPNQDEGKVRARQDLREVVENGSYEAYRHMKCYVDFVKTELIARYKKFDLADHKKPPRVRYGEMRSLFRVGELVFQQDAVYQTNTSKPDDSQLDSDNPKSDDSGPRLWRVAWVSTTSPGWMVDNLTLTGAGQMFTSSEALEFSKISVYYVDFDGKSYSSVRSEFVIPFFAEEKDITSLPIYPVRFAKDHEETLRQLQKRGEIFQSVVSQVHPVQSYEGWTLIRDPGGKAIGDMYGNNLKFPEHIEGDVIIDFHEALQINPWWRPLFGKHPKAVVMYDYTKDHFSVDSWTGKDRSKLLGRTWEWVLDDLDGVAALEYNHFLATAGSIMSIDDESTENDRNSTEMEISREDLALLPSRIFVYALRERKFVNADIQHLRQSSVKDKPFENLEIAEEHKDLIVSTVFEHFERKKVRRDAQRQGLEMSDQDFIRGKGRGLIILLHGAPGVGKTATAEACSYAYNKPLFPITCGDLGIEPQRVEETLSELFRLANLWDCILLFDEADIFLSTREKKDDNLQRNALVSIFLRTLEYYSGILFLTTNRAGALDEAVKSRVHISLYYPHLGLRETTSLFQMNIKRLQKIESERSRITGKPAMVIEEKPILKFAEDHYKRFEKEHDKRWNGRQIRNAFQIATSLARHQYHRHCEEGNSHRGLYMTSEHLKTVEDVTHKYDEYRQQLFGKTDAEIAKEREERHHPSRAR